MSIPFKILGTDHLRLIVGNAKQASCYYQDRFGFAPVAYRGLETGERALCTHVLRQGKITLALETPLDPKHPHNAHKHRRRKQLAS